MWSPLGAAPLGGPRRPSRAQGPEPHPGVRTMAHRMGRVARAPPDAMQMYGKWPLTPGSRPPPAAPPLAAHSTAQATPPAHRRVRGTARSARPGDTRQPHCICLIALPRCRTLMAPPAGRPAPLPVPLPLPRLPGVRGGNLRRARGAAAGGGCGPGGAAVRAATGAPRDPEVPSPELAPCEATPPATTQARGAEAPDASPGRPRGAAAAGTQSGEGAKYRALTQPSHTQLSPRSPTRRRDPRHPGLPPPKGGNGTPRAPPPPPAHTGGHCHAAAASGPGRARGGREGPRGRWSGGSGRAKGRCRCRATVPRSGGQGREAQRLKKIRTQMQEPWGGGLVGLRQADVVGKFRLD